MDSNRNMDFSMPENMNGNNINFTMCSNMNGGMCRGMKSESNFVLQPYTQTSISTHDAGVEISIIDSNDKIFNY